MLANSIVLQLPGMLRPLGTNNVCHAYCNSPANPKVWEALVLTDPRCKSVAALHRACGHQLGKQAATDNRSCPHSFLSCAEGCSRPPVLTHTHTQQTMWTRECDGLQRSRGWRRLTQNSYALICISCHDQVARGRVNASVRAENKNTRLAVIIRCQF